MAQLPAWMGAGVLAAGVSAALIAGADAANADTGSDTSGGTTTTSDSADAGPRGTDETSESPDAAETDADSKAEQSADATETEAAEEIEEIEEALDVPEEEAAETGSDDSPAPTDDDAAVVVEDESPDEPVEEVTPVDTGAQQPAADPPAQAEEVAEAFVAQRVSATVDAPAKLAAPQQRSLEDLLQSLVLEVVGVAVRFISGPPIAALGTDVTVRTSRLEITEGRTVRADWYYPDSDEPPQRLIYLQHGYLGVGPMYSYTASWLAHRTNSIVVAPTLSSNRYVRDGFWLGDDQVHRATADLLLGDRAALTASAVKAGLLKKYGPGAALPETFTLVGHSLGAGVAAGAAGYYADAVIASGAPSRLAGIVLLDGAPPGDVLPEALDKLEGLGAYVPVIELGAPRGSGTRRVDEALNAQRPGRFNGVVLDDGAHLDSMQGGSWLIQLISYLYQGFPTEVNKEAAQTLIAGWINDIFAGQIDPSTGACAGADCSGIYGQPGQTVSVATSKGLASGVVIGAAVAPTSVEFTPPAVDSLLPRRSMAVRLEFQGRPLE